MLWRDDDRPEEAAARPSPVPEPEPGAAPAAPAPQAGDALRAATDGDALRAAADGDAASAPPGAPEPPSAPEPDGSARIVRHRRRRRRSVWSRTVAVGLVGAIVGAAAIIGLVPAYRALASGYPQIQTVTFKPDTQAAPAVTVYQKLSPSVVLVTNQSVVNGFYGPQGQTAWGSGVIFTANGYIVTNDHVVAGAQKVTVTLKSGKAHPAKVIGQDASTDLAVIKIDATGLTPATFGNSSDVVPGQLAIAVGNPLGPQFEQSVTQGIVGAVRPMLYGLNGSTPRVTTMIQVDTPINPGNSGGALANAQGEVIGITAMKVPQTGEANVPATGLGFAIPSNTVSRIVNQLIRYGYVKRSWLGIVIQPSPAQALPSQVQTLTVTQVQSGSPAAAAGMQPGDVLLSWKAPGQPVQKLLNYYTLVEAVNQSQPGQTVQIGVDRSGQSVTLNVTLGTEPHSNQQPTAAQQQPVPQPSPGGSGGGSTVPFPFPFPFPFGR